MIDRVERLPRPEPDVGNLLAVLRRERPRRVPLLELKLDDEVITALLGEPILRWRKDSPPDERRRAIRQAIGLWHRLGYDAFRLRAGMPFARTQVEASDTAELSRGQRQWQDEHRGPIRTLDDIDEYAWPTLATVDFGPAEEIAAELPEGMGCIGFASGVFEWSSWLMGLESFSLALYDDPALVREVTDRVGRIVYEVLHAFCDLDHVVALWVGDDLGFKTGTMVSREHLREYILPWNRRFVELAHAHGRPFILHCCGNLKQVMPDLADSVGIDAKHSFEDVIEPVEEFHRQWASKVAAVGGVDVDVLARGSEQDVVRRTRQILDACAPGGAYACGSGNSVANYVPVDNYLAMVETVHRFNGRLRVR
jgi:uroporphyrinogen decarboxylase